MATNSTTYYNLPVFAATDQPKWLVDWNTTMNLIDTAIAAAKTAGDNAQTTANANAVAITGLNESVSTMSTALGTLTTNVTTLTGNVQRINELIGNGTPTTQDKTIIGAINELKAAIDALAPGGEVTAAEVSYDNTDSGLTADDVQDAIDELNTKIEAIQPGGNVPDFNLVNHATATVTAASGVTLEKAEVNALTNADASIGKIYGGLRAQFSTASANTDVVMATISNAGMPTIATAYDILIGVSNVVDFSSGSIQGLASIKLHFNTNGTIDVVANINRAVSASSTILVSLAPCIYFLKDLGDQLIVGFTPRLLEALA